MLLLRQAEHIPGAVSHRDAQPCSALSQSGRWELTAFLHTQTMAFLGAGLSAGHTACPAPGLGQLPFGSVPLLPHGPSQSGIRTRSVCPPASALSDRQTRPWLLPFLPPLGMVICKGTQRRQHVLIPDRGCRAVFLPCLPTPVQQGPQYWD